VNLPSAKWDFNAYKIVRCAPAQTHMTGRTPVCTPSDKSETARIAKGCKALTHPPGGASPKRCHHTKNLEQRISADANDRTHARVRPVPS
jgi:hypothetical protein